MSFRYKYVKICGVFKCIVCVLTGSLGLSPRAAILPPPSVCPALSRATQAEKAVFSAPAQLSRPAGGRALFTCYRL